MPAELQKRTVTITPDTKYVQAKTGESLTVIIKSPTCIVDCHAHIENGSCAPLPLLWAQNWLIRKKQRKEIDEMSTEGITGLLSTLIIGKAGSLQVKATSEIGKQVVTEIDAAFGQKSDIGKSEFYKNMDLFTCLVLQMMDMEYAGLEGFSGQTIYHEDKTPWYYYEYQSGKDLEKNRKAIKLPGENQKTFSKWFWQLKETKDAIKANPLRLFAMYHYDPRRWNYPKIAKLEDNFQKGPWDHPFTEIATKINKGLFIGFKMYPPLGYKPLDERLPYLQDRLKDGDCFYARCEREQIPILVHCSLGGMFTHDIKLYMQFDGREPKPSVEDPMPAETAKRLFSPEGYFWTNYVHPRAWREVLVRFPELKICLAHFGGNEWSRGLDSDWVTEIISLTKEYKNVYTDFSCWNLEKSKDVFADLLSSKQHSHLKEKILFGTDWYMTLLALGGKSYKKFCEEFWEFFNEIPGGMKLWQQFTFINPFTFYGFNSSEIINNITSKLEELKVKNEALKNNLAAFQRLKDVYDKIKADNK
jgi:hypothetical protein